MALLKLLLGFRTQYNQQKRSYQKRSSFVKILYLLMLIGFGVVGIGLELWAFSLVNKNLFGLITTAISAGSTIIFTVKTTTVHSVVALINAIRATVKDARAAKKTPTGDVCQIQDEKIYLSKMSVSEDIVYVKKPPKPSSNKILDVFIGVTCILLSISVSVIAVAIISIKLPLV